MTGDAHVHTWVRCEQCTSTGPCACSGGICCPEQEREIAGRVPPATWPEEARVRAVEALDRREPPLTVNEAWLLVTDILNAAAPHIAAAERARSDAQLESLREQNAALSEALGEAEEMIERTSP